LLDAAGCGQAVVAARVPVDHRKRIGAFGQYHFELGIPGHVEIDGLPPDDELPVGRTSHRLGKDTAVWARLKRTIHGEHVIIEWKQGIGPRTVWSGIYRDTLHVVE
jgi:hypothetical protein